MPPSPPLSTSDTNDPVQAEQKPFRSSGEVGIASFALMLSILGALLTLLAHVSFEFFSSYSILYAVSFYGGLICNSLSLLLGLFTCYRWKGIAAVAISMIWWIWLYWGIQRYGLS